MITGIAESDTQLKVLSMHTHSQREGLRVQQLVAGTVPADGSIQSVALHMSYKPEEGEGRGQGRSLTRVETERWRLAGGEEDVWQGPGGLRGGKDGPSLKETPEGD